MSCGEKFNPTVFESMISTNYSRWRPNDNCYKVANIFKVDKNWSVDNNNNCLVVDLTVVLYM